MRATDGAGLDREQQLVGSEVGYRCLAGAQRATLDRIRLDDLLHLHPVSIILERLRAQSFTEAIANTKWRAARLRAPLLDPNA